MKYRTKPTLIEAIQYIENNYDEVCNFVGRVLRKSLINPSNIIIETLNGDKILSINDFIVKDMHGNFCPYKPHIFNITYEKAEWILRNGIWDMSRKFSIVNTIDIYKLDEEITKYIYETGEDDPYIFMSDDTVDAIIKATKIPCVKSETRPNYVTAKYCGCTIFSNNEMKFGEVEIR